MFLDGLVSWIVLKFICHIENDLHCVIKSLDRQMGGLKMEENRCGSSWLCMSSICL